MGVNITSSSTQVTISGSVTTTLTKRSVTPISGLINGAATTTIGTVGAGKVWRIIGASLVGDTGTNTQTMSIKAGGTDILNIALTGVATYLKQSATMTLNYENAIVLTEGQTVQTYASAAQAYGYANVWYVEEAA